MNTSESDINNKSVKTNLIGSIIGITVSLVVVIVVFVFNKDTHVSIKNLWDFNYYYFSLALLIFLSVVFINGFRVKLMAWFLKNRISLSKATNAVFMGLYVSNITPSAIGGQPYQVYLMTQYGIDAGISSAIVVTQFVTINIFNLIVDFCFLPYLLHFSGMSYMWIPFILGFSIFLFMMFSIVFVTFNRKVLIKFMDFIFSIKFVRWGYKVFKKDPDEEKDKALEQMSNFHDSTLMVWSKKKIALILDFILAMLSRSLLFLVPYVFYLSFFPSGNAVLHLSDFIAVQVVTQHVAYFIPTPGSSGGFEATFLYLFASKINPKILSMVILGWRFVTYYFVIIMGTIINIFMSLKMNRETSV